MAAKESLEIPVGMRRVCRRFERWREGHKARLPIPEALWAAAAEAAREHGVFRAAKALRLEYGKLKRMVETSPALARPAMAPGNSFGTGAAPGRWSRRVPDRVGRATRQDAHPVERTTAPDLAALSRVLWESA